MTDQREKQVSITKWTETQEQFNKALGAKKNNATTALCTALEVGQEGSLRDYCAKALAISGITYDQAKENLIAIVTPHLSEKALQRLDQVLNYPNMVAFYSTEFAAASDRFR